MAQNPNIDDETRARARRFVEDADMPKPAVTGRALPAKQRIVSKKELEESGLSLRDFLNRERGLTRRGMSVTDAKKQLGLDKIDQEVSARADRAPRRTPEPLTSTRKPGTNVNYENSDATSETFKKGGKVRSASARADGCCVRGKTRA